MTTTELARLEFCHSQKLPQKIKYRKTEKEPWRFREWVGIGWIECDPSDDAVEITDDPS